MIFGIVGTISFICIFVKEIFNQPSEPSPFDCIRHLSTKQIKRILDAEVEVNNLCLNNKNNNQSCNMKDFYFENEKEFNLDLSEVEFKAFLNILDWYYYDKEKHKIRTIKL